MKTILNALALTLATLSLSACDLGDLEDDGAGDGGTSDAEEGDAADADDANEEGEGDAADSASEDDESGGSEPPSGDDAGDPADEVPPELLGLWVVGGSAIALYEFRADGTYVAGNRAEATIGYCTNVYELVVEGEVTVSGNVLELVPTSGWKRTDECGTVTEESYLPDPSQKAWSLGQDEHGETLTLEDEDGPITYHRG